MRHSPGSLFKHILSAALILSVGGLGVLAAAVTLFPPDGDQTDLTTTILGLAFSALFLLLAWGIRRWSKRCLLCEIRKE